MKGAELPINTLIIIILAVIVFTIIILIYSGVIMPGKTTISLTAAKDRACTTFVDMGCTNAPKNIYINDFDADKDGLLDAGPGWAGWEPTIVHPTDDDNDNLASLCWNYYFIKNEADCTALCNC